MKRYRPPTQAEAQQLWLESQADNDAEREGRTPTEARLKRQEEAFQRLRNRSLYYTEVEQRRPKGKLWNRQGLGYDSAIWPFDAKKAIQNPGYCKGVVNASKSSSFDSIWRNAAKILLNDRVIPAIEAMAAYLEDEAVKDEHGL
jgi:hypothetical protein